MFLGDPDITATEESFAHNNVTITLHLKKILNQGSVYDVSFTVSPYDTMHEIVVIDNETAIITVPYNTYYNVSVLGTADIYGYSGALSSIQNLFYGENHTLLSRLIITIHRDSTIHVDRPNYAHVQTIKT